MLPMLGTVIVVVEARFDVSAWTLVSSTIAITASAVLPFLLPHLPRGSLLIATLAAAASPGAIPVLGLVGCQGLRCGPRRMPWLIVPLVSAAMALGLALRHILGIAPGAAGAAIAAAIVLGLVALVMWITRPRRPAARAADAVDPEWLTRRIHDGVGHRLALLSVHARAQIAGGTTSSEAWDLIAVQVENAFADLRRLLSEVESALPRRDPAEEFDDFVAEARRLGVPVALIGRHLLDRLEVDRRALAAAVCREGIANAAQHGGLGTVQVRLERLEPDVLLVTVRSPRSSDPRQLTGGGHGLEGLREMLRRAQGHDRSWVRTTIDRGDFVLQAEIAEPASILVAARPPVR